MEPEQIKEKVQSAFRNAIANTSVQWNLPDSTNQLFRGVRLFGRDAGIDFVTTNLTAIVEEAVSTAECKGTSLQMIQPGSGNAALDGMVETLRELTGLLVERQGSTITLIWADAGPRLV